MEVIKIVIPKKQLESFLTVEKITGMIEKEFEVSTKVEWWGKNMKLKKEDILRSKQNPNTDYEVMDIKEVFGELILKLRPTNKQFRDMSFIVVYDDVTADNYTKVIKKWTH